MKKSPIKRKRPGVLVRFYPSDLNNLNRVVGERQTPRESWIRRLVLRELQNEIPKLANPDAGRKEGIAKPKHK